MRPQFFEPIVKSPTLVIPEKLEENNIHRIHSISSKIVDMLDNESRKQPLTNTEVENIIQLVVLHCDSRDLIFDRLIKANVERSNSPDVLRMSPYDECKIDATIRHISPTPHNTPMLKAVAPKAKTPDFQL